MIAKLIRWFFANAILPVFIPVCSLSIVGWYKDGTISFVPIFLELVRNGFYVFSALTLILSLIEDYPLFDSAGIGTGYGAWFMLLIVMTIFIFYRIQIEETSYIQNHGLQFLITWFLSAVSAFRAKYRIIKYKNKKQESYEY